MENQEKRRGRPPGKEAAHMKTFRLRDEDERRLKAIVAVWGCSEVAAIRRLLLDAARREKID